jgi:hypothetical protein
MSDKDILRLFIDILSYPSILYPPIVSMQVSVKNIHVKYPNYILIVTLLYPTLFIGPAGVLHDEIIWTVTSGFSMLRSAAPVPSRKLEPLREFEP